MNVLLVNGSPHKKGCIYTGLSVVAETLMKELVQRFSILEQNRLQAAYFAENVWNERNV